MAEPKVAAEPLRFLKPHETRVILERKQLAEKVNKLEAFTTSPVFAGVCRKERDLLTQQLEHMAMYLAILDLRVADFTQAKRYVCHKEVLGYPMNRGDYNNLRGWDLPPNEVASDPGYLVEYLDGGEANHPDFAGYISWSPKAVFERGYSEKK